MADDTRHSLVKPPRLDLGREGSASRLELFFDLAYVLVVMELAKNFYEDMTWPGAAELTGLFVTLWFSWVGFTLYANRFDTDDLVFRIAKLIATASIVGCAASASDAIGTFAVPFAASYLGSRLVLFALYLRAWRHVPEARSTIRVYLITVGVSAALWAVSLGVPDPARYWWWAVAVAVSAAGPVAATFTSERVPLQIEHLPERFGLLVILVLGEAVGGAARGVHDASWTLVPLVVGVLAFAVAAGMWWIYFDITAPSSEQGLQDEDDEQGTREQDADATPRQDADPSPEQDADATPRQDADPSPEQDADATPEQDADPTPDSGGRADARHDLFVYGHLPLTLGIVLAGVGLEELVVHPDTPGPSSASWTFACGLAIFLAGVTLVISGTTRTVSAVWPWPAVGIPLALLAALVPFPSSLALVATYAVGTLLLAWQGTRASRRPDTPLAGTD